MDYIFAILQSTSKANITMTSNRNGNVVYELSGRALAAAKQLEQELRTELETVSVMRSGNVRDMEDSWNAMYQGLLARLATDAPDVLKQTGLTIVVPVLGLDQDAVHIKDDRFDRHVLCFSKMCLCLQRLIRAKQQIRAGDIFYSFNDVPLRLRGTLMQICRHHADPFSLIEKAVNNLRPVPVCIEAIKPDPLALIGQNGVRLDVAEAGKRRHAVLDLAHKVRHRHIKDEVIGMVECVQDVFDARAEAIGLDIQSKGEVAPVHDAQQFCKRHRRASRHIMGDYDLAVMIAQIRLRPQAKIKGTLERNTLIAFVLVMPKTTVG